MAQVDAPSLYAAGFLDGIKKDYQKLKEKCGFIERDQSDFFRRIGLDLDAFNIELHPVHPAEDVFEVMDLSDRDRKTVGEYLDSREKMYLLEQCVRSITDDDTRNIAESYYLERKSQPEIAAEIGRYLAWKYTVPGGKSCFWAGKQEKQYMREQDARHLIFHMPELPDMSWVKKLRRMGF